LEGVRSADAPESGVLCRDGGVLALAAGVAACGVALAVPAPRQGRAPRPVRDARSGGRTARATVPRPVRRRPQFRVARRGERLAALARHALEMSVAQVRYTRIAIRSRAAWPTNR